MATPKRARREVRVRVLARIAALAALGRDQRLAREVRGAKRSGITIKGMREAILQTFLFAGFPRAVNALEILEEELGPLRPEMPETLPTGSARRSHLRRRGLELFKRVYGDDASRVLERIGRQHLEFRDWIVVDAYGKVLGRKGLTPAERECIAVGLLAALDLPRQQVPHVRGALRCGATPEEIGAAIDGVEGIALKRAVAFARKRLRLETASKGP